MTLILEQFNLLATKEDLKDLKQEMATKKDVGKLLVAIDVIAKSFKDHEIEHISTIAAHNRFEERINTLEKIKN